MLDKSDGGNKIKIELVKSNTRMRLPCGIVAANIPYHQSFVKFEQAWIGPWGAAQVFPSRWWMRVEHWAFWLGLAVFLFGFYKTGTWKEGWEGSEKDLNRSVSP